jgi:hypothetical protein
LAPFLSTFSVTYLPLALLTALTARPAACVDILGVAEDFQLGKLEVEEMFAVMMSVQKLASVVPDN